VHRAMPYPRPGTLNSDEVYALTAYILALNGIISDTTELNQRSLPHVRMPNRDGFIPDSRPDIRGSRPGPTRTRKRPSWRLHFRWWSGTERRAQVRTSGTKTGPMSCVH